MSLLVNFDCLRRWNLPEELCANILMFYFYNIWKLKIQQVHVEYKKKCIIYVNSNTSSTPPGKNYFGPVLWNRFIAYDTSDFDSDKWVLKWIKHEHGQMYYLYWECNGVRLIQFKCKDKYKNNLFKRF